MITVYHRDLSQEKRESRIDFIEVEENIPLTWDDKARQELKLNLAV